MWKALDDWHQVISIAGKNITNLRYADDAALIAAPEKEKLDLLNRVGRGRTGSSESDIRRIIGLAKSAISRQTKI